MTPPIHLRSRATESAQREPPEGVAVMRVAPARVYYASAGEDRAPRFGATDHFVETDVAPHPHTGTKLRAPRLLQSVVDRATRECATALDFSHLQKGESLLAFVAQTRPAFFTLLEYICALLGVALPLVLATILTETRGKMRADHGHGLGLGQFVPEAWGAVTRSEEFQNPWKEAWNGAPPPMPLPGHSVVADILVIAARYQRIARYDAIPLPLRAADFLAAPQRARRAVAAARVLYARPAFKWRAHAVLRFGAGAVARGSFRAGFVALADLTFRLAREYAVHHPTHRADAAGDI